MKNDINKKVKEHFYLKDGYWYQRVVGGWNKRIAIDTIVNYRAEWRNR